MTTVTPDATAVGTGHRRRGPEDVVRRRGRGTRRRRGPAGRRRAGRDRRAAATSSTRLADGRPSRTTASRPASARWPPSTSRPSMRAQLQRSLIRSHAAGSGPEVEREVVRALMLLRLSTLATGRTGVRVETAAGLRRACSTPGITPVVHEYGSLGCSGDLAPLSPDRAGADGRGRRSATPTACCARPPRRCATHGIEPVELAEKEGLALVNGTDGMLGMLVLALADLRRLLDHRRRRRGDERRGAAGHRRRLRRRPAGAAPAPGPGRVARPTCARCWPAAASWPATAGPSAPACRTPTRCAAPRRCTAPPATPSPTPPRSPAASSPPPIDNPVVTLDGRVESNGNFHGAPVGYVLDFLAIAVADVASMSERRTDRFLDVARSHGLPPFLADDPGVDSGHMIAQYTAAGIVSELKRLAVPASVDSIPSSAMQEDHVSMGWAAARKLRRAVDGLTRVLAIEILTAARALDLRAPLAPAARDRRRARRRPRSRRRRPRPRPAPGPEIEAVVGLVARRRRCSTATGLTLLTAERRGSDHGRRTTRTVPARHDPDRPQLADRGAAADAAEQPRPRGGRAPRRPRRLRRHRPGGARLAQLRRDGAHADHAARTTRRCSCSPAGRSA